MGGAVAEAIIRIRALEKVFPHGTVAVNKVSFDVPRGQFLAVIGPSGAGKSTILRCLNRLVEPTRGQLEVEGQDVTRVRGAALRALRRRMGMIFQQFNLVRRSTVLTNVMSGRLGYRDGPRLTFSRTDRDIAWRALERMDIAEKAYDRADSLSGGQQQRVAIARALAPQPSILLADEPIASLDPETSVVVLDYLKRINEEDRITLVCNIHHLELAKRYAHRLIAMRRGEVVYDGLPDRLDETGYRTIYGRLGYE
jgi:phosphonate transport system ATP-binding protein